MKSAIKLGKVSKIGFLPNFNISHEKIILESEKPQNLTEIFGSSKDLDTKARDNALTWLESCRDTLEKKSLYVGQCICFFLMSPDKQTAKNRDDWVLAPQVGSGCLVNENDKTYVLTALHTYLKDEEEKNCYLRLNFYVKSDIDFSNFCMNAHQNLISQCKRTNLKKLSLGSLKKYLQKVIGTHVIQMRGCYAFTELDKKFLEIRKKFIENNEKFKKKFDKNCLLLDP